MDGQARDSPSRWHGFLFGSKNGARGIHWSGGVLGAALLLLVRHIGLGAQRPLPPEPLLPSSAPRNCVWSTGTPEPSRVRPLQTPPRTIRDAIHVSMESDVLIARFEEYFRVVDELHVFENNLTQQGAPKPLHFCENQHRYRKYSGKIRYHRIPNLPDYEHRPSAARTPPGPTLTRH